jgi:hypothetical protein
MNHVRPRDENLMRPLTSPVDAAVDAVVGAALVTGSVLMAPAFHAGSLP